MQYPHCYQRSNFFSREAAIPPPPTARAGCARKKSYSMQTMALAVRLAGGAAPGRLRALFPGGCDAEKRRNKIKPKRITGPRRQHSAAYAKIHAKDAIGQKQFGRGEVQSAAKHRNQSYEDQKLPHAKA
jgi:hypothetical protein